MVLVHVCFIYNTAILFTLTKSAKTYGQTLEHWQNYNNSNGKLALKHIVPFPTENDDCKISSPCSRTMTMIFNLFSTSRLSHRKKYIGKIIILSHFTFHLVWSTQRISKIFSAYTKTYSFYRAIRMLTPEWGNMIFFFIFFCFGVGARETRLSDNMALGWKTEWSAITSTKNVVDQASNRPKYRLVRKLSDQISTNVIKPLKC